MPWSEARDGWEVSRSLCLPTCTVWRCTEAFALHGLPGRGSPLRRSLPQLVAWLGTEGPSLRLHVVLQVGGGEARRAWLGLSARGLTPEDAAARLHVGARDLGEALDAWGLFPDAPSAGPALPPSTRSVAQVGSSRPGHGHGHGDLRLLGALRMLERRDRRWALSIELRPASTSPDLVRDVARVRRQARFLRDDAPLPWFCDPSASDVGHAQVRLSRLWEEVTASQVWVRLHGPSLGPLLRATLEDALSDDLGLPVEVVPGPAEPLRGARRVLDAVFGALAAGRPRSDHTDDADDAADTFDPDEIPF